MPFLPPNQQCQSTEVIKEKHNNVTGIHSNMAKSLPSSNQNFPKPTDGIPELFKNFQGLEFAAIK